VRTPSFRLSNDGEVQILAIDRPPANALGPDLVREGAEIFEGWMASPPPALVITGTGAFFSAGADLRVVPDLPAGEMASLSRYMNVVFANLYQFRRPVVAAVNGHAVAGGLVLALCADHRVVGQSGRFGLTEVKVGIPFPSAAMAVVQGELTPAVVRRLVFGSELFDARTAIEYDIFDEQVDDDRVLDRAIEVAHQFASLPQSTYEIVKNRLRFDAFDRTRGVFGGADAAGPATAEARQAARKVLDSREE
jgi:enoyl-CoA hydratase